MTVFKAYLKILNKYKFTIILYTALLIFFGGFNIENSDANLNFAAEKPDVLIVNKDEDVGLTANLIDYLETRTKVKNIKIDEESIDDALFYRDINYCIYIPKDFGLSFLNGENPKIEVKSTGDYQASLAEMLLNKYLTILNTYRTLFDEEDKILKKVDEVLDKEVEVELTTTLDTTSLEKACTFYNFTNYCILAGLIYIICLIMSSFKNPGVFKRTVISSTNYKTLNRHLLLSNGLFALFLWAIYVILSIILVGDIMFEVNGLLLMANSFVFTFCSLTIALLLGNIISNKEAVSGIVNVIALGSSFLCGSFVPMSFLPKSVLSIAHILPSYWFISSNEMIKSLEKFDINSLTPFLTNIVVLLSFSFVFILLTNLISRKKRKLA